MGNRAVYCCGEVLDVDELIQYLEDGLCPECNVNWRDEGDDCNGDFCAGCGQFKIDCQGKEDCGIDD